MRMDVDVELLATLARIGKTDRELYRQLRREAWDMVAARHGRLTSEERAMWLRNAS